MPIVPPPKVPDRPSGMPIIVAYRKTAHNRAIKVVWANRKIREFAVETRVIRRRRTGKRWRWETCYGMIGCAILRFYRSSLYAPEEAWDLMMGATAQYCYPAPEFPLAFLEGGKVCGDWIVFRVRRPVTMEIWIRKELLDVVMAEDLFSGKENVLVAFRDLEAVL